MSATMPKICRHPDGTDNCDCGGLTGEVCRWVKIIADEQADWDRREKVEYLTAERIRLKRRIGELEEQLRAAQPAPIAGLEPVASLLDELREYTALRYVGDCKCGNCQLVPRATLDKAIRTIARLEAHAAEQVRPLVEALEGLIEAVELDADEGLEGIGSYTGARLTDAKNAIRARGQV